MAKDKAPSFITANPVVEGNVTVYYSVDVNKSLEALAIRFKTGIVADLRETGPYLAMSPCPYCGAANDRGHDPLKHIDTTLGAPSV